jgi:hypothetical protein
MTDINKDGVDYKYIENVDSGGNDLTGMDGNEDDCLAKCNDLEECRGFAYDKLDKVCYIKNDGIYHSRRGPNVNQDVYLKDPNSHIKHVIKDDVDYRYIENVDSGGNDLTGMGGNADDCLSKCNELEECRGLAYDKLDKVCYIKNSGIYNSRRGPNANQDVYLKDPNAHVKVHKIPVLSNNDFADKFSNIENFTNDSDKIINRGYNELYNEIFCNLFITNNGFNTCENCNLLFNKEEKWKSYKLSGDSDCLEKCSNDQMCTSYTFDKKSSNINCNLYSSFPKDIDRNVDSINSGYSLNFPFDYNNLSDLQKKNIQKKCINQYINNTYTPDKKINLEECITIDNKKILQEEDGKNEKITHIDLDPKCVWNIYNNKGVSNNVKREYNNDDSNNPSHNTDFIIDKYKTFYNINRDLETQIININNNRKNDDINSDYDSTLNNKNQSLQSNMNNSINNLSNNINNTALNKNIINFPIETYSNQYNYTDFYKIFGLILIIIIIIIIVIFFLK